MFIWVIAREWSDSLDANIPDLGLRKLLHGSLK